MTVRFPAKFRDVDAGSIFMSNEAGDFFFTNEQFLDAYAAGTTTEADDQFLQNQGFQSQSSNDLYFYSYLSRLVKRQTYRTELSYIILVPTLRCDLSCSYCQVSRVAENAIGFDWSEETTEHVINFLDGLETKSIKIEFQGGEPTIRMDLLSRISSFCRQKFDEAQFVVCTNLQRLDEEVLTYYDNEDVTISTSLDGDINTHTKNRTVDHEITDRFFANLDFVLKRFGPNKVSALPTIELSEDFDPTALYEAYASYGFKSIYFRPVNYQGFARKKHSDSIDNFALWRKVYFNFLDLLISEAADNPNPIDEYYFTLCLKRFFQAGHDSHVDLRNPNPFGRDYLLVDYDGQIYPTDEARMLARVGQVDLSMGKIGSNFDTEKLNQLNYLNMNNIHEECIHCAYQYACGTDLVDDLSRYGRVDIPKVDTWFCRKQLAIFDRIAGDLASDNRNVLSVYERWMGLPDQTLSEGIIRYDPTNH